MERKSIAEISTENLIREKKNGDRMFVIVFVLVILLVPLLIYLSVSGYNTSVLSGFIIGGSTVAVLNKKRINEIKAELKVRSHDAKSNT